jgi:CO/xanthine dehydrogenase Mo-binding subunit
MPQSGVQLKADRSGRLTVLCGASDIGQGSDGMLAYIVAEETGILPDDVRVVTPPTPSSPRSTSAPTRQPGDLHGGTRRAGGRRAAAAA